MKKGNDVTLTVVAEQNDRTTERLNNSDTDFLILTEAGHEAC